MADVGFAISLENVSFTWQKGKPSAIAIERLQIDRGERIFIKGRSGSGKSTLLNLVAGVITPLEGNIQVLGEPLSRLPGGSRDRFRADHIGFVFQIFNLIPYLSVLENVTLPCRFSAKRRARAESPGPDGEAKRLIHQLGLKDVIENDATDLSVGQQQRVAVARALLGAPEIVVADEPTSALDTDTRDSFISLLMAECERNAATLLFVSHDGGLAAHFDRMIDLDTINQAV